MSPRRRSGEGGAIAIVFTVCALALFSVAALVVDIGNAYSRKRDIQTQADLAAMAAAAHLPHDETSQPLILSSVEAYAGRNLIQGQTASPWVIEFPDEDTLRVTTPPAEVDFGLAGAMGYTGTQVAASAAAVVRTPSAALPFFVPSVCSWGSVAIGDPPPGHDEDDGPCAGASSGNFGALLFPRDDETGTDETAARNIVEGIQHDLAVFEDYAGEIDSCAEVVGAVTVPDSPIPDGPEVNCLETDTGNVKSAATSGFITGVGEDLGRLDAAEHPTAPNCDPTGIGQSDATILDTQVNNDVLTCFFINSSVTVGDVGQEDLAAADEHVISAAIFESPRFFWLPVISDEPVSGGSKSYAVLGFRGAFLTGQPADASRSDPKTAVTVGAGNGLQVGSNQIQGVNVALIHPDALPETAAPTGRTIPYLGTGTKVIRLVE